MPADAGAEPSDLGEADLGGAVERLKAAWITGASATAQAPKAWGALAEDELATLALAGQALRVALRPAPPPLTDAPDLPRLALPPLPEALRPRFRRLIGTMKTPEHRLDVLGLMAARGYAAHPDDWMPVQSAAKTPALYAPWIDWLAQGKTTSGLVLSADTWDDFAPTARRACLQEMRERDPDAARALIEAKAGESAADARLRLIEILEDGLCQTDAPYLKSLSGDRSAKVRALAARLLGRLGLAEERAEDTEALAKTVAEFFSVRRAGLLSRQHKITAHPAKTAAQRLRRSRLLQNTTVAGLCGALGLDALALAKGWPLETEAGMLTEFTSVVIATGSDEAAEALFQRLPRREATLRRRLLDRLPPARRAALLAEVLATDEPPFSESVACVSPPGTLALSAFSRAHGLRVFIDAAPMDETGRTKLLNFGAFAEGAHALALMLDQEGARTLFERLTEAGLSRFDPSLAFLAFNAALDGRTP